MRKKPKNQDGLDWTYMTGLVREMVGESILACLKLGSFDDRCVALVLYQNLGPLIAAKVDRLRDETAGHVAGYGTALGNPHNLDTHRPQFINRTGFVDIFGENGIRFFEDNRPGAQLRQLAVATIICVLRDMILQDKWLAEWDLIHSVKDENGVDGDIDIK